MILQVCKNCKMLIKSRLCIAGVELQKGSLGVGKLDQYVP